MPEMYDTCQEKTGAHCAQYLFDYCTERKADLPEWYIHSMNPVGVEKITSILNSNNSRLALH